MKISFASMGYGSFEKVRKIVDRLHMKNHKNPECKVKYGSDDLKEKFPHLNTPVAEQTFIWSGRFKKIMCAMPKRRFLFFYHRMVKHRNNYISDCYKENRCQTSASGLPWVKMHCNYLICNDLVAFFEVGHGQVPIYSNLCLDH